MKKNNITIFTGLLAVTLLLSACSNSNGGNNTQTGTANTSTTVTSKTSEVNSSPTDWDKIPDSDFGYEYDSKLKGVDIYYKGNSASKLRFPDTINGDPVVAISQSQSRTPASIKAVYIPKSVKVIEPGAFSGYTELTSITIPDGVTEIASDAFKNCTGLTSLTIPNSVKTIDTAFQGCKGLTSLTLPNNLTSIAPDTFMNCTELTKVTIPDSVTSIGYYAFAGCTKLTDITFPKEVDKVDIVGDAFQGTYWYNRKPDGLVRIGNTVLCYKGEKPTNITIPDGVTRISDRTFQNWDKLKSVTIPDSVTSLGEGAFLGCSSLDEATKSRIHQINSNARFDY